MAYAILLLVSVIFNICFSVKPKTHNYNFIIYYIYIVNDKGNDKGKDTGIDPYDDAATLYI